MNRIAVGMSGGVDSSVAAYLLKEEGYEVIGVTMCVYGEGDIHDMPICEDAKMVCDKLGIEHFVLDLREKFKKEVIDDFICEYENGRTPNPCLRCNRFLKWGALLEFCDEHGIEKLATGHYGNIVELPNGRLSVKKSDFDKKDQSYALCRLTQEQLKRTVMPLGVLEKEKVREIAKEAGLGIESKPDSEDICFIPDNDHYRFITENSENVCKPGSFTDKNGNVLGEHKGIIRYTLGQRKGLGIALGHPAFVTGIDVKNNRVILSDNEDLFHTGLTALAVNMMGIEELVNKRCIGKIRYAHKGAACTANLKNGVLYVEFDEPQRAITPGQAVVLYEDEVILASGVIEDYM